MLPKVSTVAEFLLTNFTRQPRTFIVWLQQMSVEMDKLCKSLWTVFTWMRLFIKVNLLRLSCTSVMLCINSYCQSYFGRNLLFTFSRKLDQRSIFRINLANPNTSRKCFFLFDLDINKNLAEWSTLRRWEFAVGMATKHKRLWENKQ